MKLTSLFLTLFFALGLADLPAGLFQASAPKSCCCSAGKVCRCQHGTVSFCPMKKMKEEQAAMQGKSHCELQREKAQKEAVKKAEAAGKALLKAFGCGSAEEHKAAPSYSKDFNIYSPANEFFPQKPDFFWGRDALDPFRLFSYPLEKPPQLAFPL